MINMAPGAVRYDHSEPYINTVGLNLSSGEKEEGVFQDLNPYLDPSLASSSMNRVKTASEPHT